MEKCRVYKDINSPCKVKGLTSRNFKIMFASIIIVGGIIFNSFTSALSRGGLNSSFIINSILEIGGLLALYIYFYKVSNRPKIVIKKKGVKTVSNRILFKNLYAKQNG